MVFGGSQQETLDPGFVLLGTRQQGVPVILRELVLPGGFDLEKTTNVATASAAVGLNIHKGKSRILRYNTAYTKPITIDREDLEDVKTFTYLGSIIDEQGGSDADVKARIGKARAAYLQLKNIWNSKQLSVNQHQSQNFLFKCQDSSTVWGGNLENYESHHSEDTGVY
ncbi:unnamed protein product [Schistosoma margrebowiei]|uniref:Uncharacterized protein n=1 Tax=Schistosoma margrebowiei TaxID=48269 RepID=A0A183MP13_9TREM|nr:unnamed protein product [Schistosoma margrebowiei]